MSECKVKPRDLDFYRLGDVEKPDWIVKAFAKQRIQILDKENALVMQDPDDPTELTFADADAFIVKVPLYHYLKDGGIDYFLVFDESEFYEYFEVI